MANSTTDWIARIENDSLFLDNPANSRVVLQHNSRKGLRPYIHPLRLYDGVGCLTEDSPWHHPWQHGISTGFHGVNGCDFWFDPGQVPATRTGSIEPSTPRLAKIDPPTWEIDAIWRDVDGTILLVERQNWSLQLEEEILYLDLAWNLQAIPGVVVDQGLYGGLFLRMPFRKDRGADVLNSKGIADDECEQKAAEWVDLNLPIDSGDTRGGIVMCDHPGNPEHPAHWRIDGTRGINPAPCITRPIELRSGETMSYRYRLIGYRDRLPREKIKQLWENYAAT